MAKLKGREGNWRGNKVGEEGRRLNEEEGGGEGQLHDALADPLAVFVLPHHLLLLASSPVPVNLDSFLLHFALGC
jgi:hypothetical protein